jgi:translation elongation factor Ts
MSTLEQIKTLREKTGAGLGACKQALAESNNDVEAAIVYLRKKGLADMAKRAGRETKEGRVAIKTSADGKHIAMAYLGCETDFVAKTPDFIALVEKIADYIIANHNRKTYNKEFTAMFCVSSVDTLIKYYDILQQKKISGQHNLKVATIFWEIQ